MLKPAFFQGLLTSQHLDKPRLHRLLLAYYRILQANRQLPDQLFWPLSHLSAIIWTPTFDSGSRLLAIRCYTSQSGMCEAEHEKLQQEILGDACGAGCPLEYGHNIDGSVVEVDGWIMPVLEVKRIRDARNHIAVNVNDYFSEEQAILASELRYGLIFLHDEEVLIFLIKPTRYKCRRHIIAASNGRSQRFFSTHQHAHYAPCSTFNRTSFITAPACLVDISSLLRKVHHSIPPRFLPLSWL